MPQITWSTAALADVKRIHRFLEAKNLNAADRAVDAIDDAIQILRANPEIARLADNEAMRFIGCRELLAPFGQSGYVVLYLPVDDEVLILAVRHQREIWWFDKPPDVSPEE